MIITPAIKEEALNLFLQKNCVDYCTEINATLYGKMC